MVSDKYLLKLRFFNKIAVLTQILYLRDECIYVKVSLMTIIFMFVLYSGFVFQI